MTYSLLLEGDGSGVLYDIPSALFGDGSNGGRLMQAINFKFANGNGGLGSSSVPANNLNELVNPNTNTVFTCITGYDGRATVGGKSDGRIYARAYGLWEMVQVYENLYPNGGYQGSPN